jgi:signal transduction histidine kinase/CheY-like chemotaxis protein
MYVYTNPRWTEITGVTSEQAAGKDWDTAVGAVARPDLIPEPLNGTTDPAELSKHYEIRAEGSPSRIVLLTARTIEDDEDGVVGWVGTLLDVTAEIGADAALSDARDQATEASRLKSDFLANMSHEIRTPMNGVIGMTDLLLETDLDARQRDYALTVRTSGEAMVTIINDILDFSKVEAGKLEIEDVEFNLRTVVGDVVDLLAGPARSKGLELRSDVEDSVPAHVGGDPGRVRQVLINLIGNAIKFTQRGEIVIRARELKVEGKASIVRFEVSDTGDGIDPKKLKTIFQPFVQADTSTSRKYGGTGLGLAISGQLVALMGGDCGVSSKLGKGSDFWFTISIRANPEEAVEGSPQADSDPANSQWSSNDLMEPTPFVPTIVPNLKVVEDMGPTVPEDDLALIPSAETAARVLLVEDHPVNQRVASAMIESLGYEVDLACDGAAAVKIAQSTPYLAILMDCQMPILDGYEATRQIRELEGPRGSTPIIAVTASAMKIDEDRCLEAGMDDYMAKPLTLKALGATLSRWIPGDDSPGGQHDPSTRPPHDFPVPTQLAPLQATS